MDLENIELKKEKTADNSARVVIEPLPSGFGVTLGTALRRVLLSSLPGGAITQLNIKGVSHPFTTIDGVQEDVVDIMLNLKKVRFKMHAKGPFEGTIEATGNKRGNKEVKAKDIDISSEAEVVDSDMIIATLTDEKVKFSANLVVEKGVGYSPAEEKETDKVGVIPMDSVFSPVVNVSFNVEETRLGRQTGLDRLILDVTTDGTIDAGDAVEEAAGILQSYFTVIAGVEEEEEEEKEKEEEGPDEETRKRPVSELGLSPRAVNTLEDASVKTVGGLIQKTEEDLLEIKGFGEASLDEVKEALEDLGVSLKE